MNSAAHGDLKSLEQQTATRRCSSVIVRSPGDLQPVFPGHAGERDAVLRGQVRQFSSRGRGFRTCTACAELPPECCRIPEPVIALSKSRSTAGASEAGGHLPGSAIAAHAYIERRSLLSARLSRLGGAPSHVSGTDAEGRRADWRHRYLPAGGPSLHRKADRAGDEFRRPGRHRHREYAAAQ